MFFEIVIIFITSFILLSFIEIWKRPKNIPPGPIMFPLVGNALQIFQRRTEKPYDMLHNLSKTYGPIMFIKLGILNQVILEDYETIKEVLNSDIWIDRRFDEYIARRSFGKELGILVVNGAEVWREMRRFSIRTLRDFGFGKQKSMEATLEEELEELSRSLSDQLATGNSIVKMRQYFTISVLNILWNMIAGYRFSQQDEKIHKLLGLLDAADKSNAIGSTDATVAIAFPFIGKTLYFLSKHYKIRRDLFSNIHQFFRDILKERREEGRYKEEQRDFIDVFLSEIDAHIGDENKSGTNHYTDEQFIVVSMDLFMAGSETTSNTMEFAILYMILHPEVQRKVQAEIDSVIGQSRFPSMLLDKPKMPYTEATLLEVQRLANVLPIIARAPTNDTTLGKYHIPKNTLGIINLHAMHTNEKNWKEPHTFNPERFLDECQNVVNANKILPFGSGKRSCLGELLARASLFTFFTTFLQKFTFEPSPDHEPPTMKPILGFTLSPKPYHAFVKPRFA